MSETLSLNAMIENPTVFVLAQRPGPATGLPTWTAQSGLLQAASCSAGEFTRCVIAVSNSQDAFDLMPVAFNLAEQYQISVIVLTDKQIAEALYTQHPYDLEKAEIDRGRLVIDPEKLKLLKSSDRFNPHAQGGVSFRWLPGSDAATYCAQGDEHNSIGAVDESSRNAKLQMEKRLRKFVGL
jgi:2-oxoglutarate ferredoxin oxidoreductase subunit alpha